MNGFPSFYKDKIQYDEAERLREAIRKANHIYDHNKERQLKRPSTYMIITKGEEMFKTRFVRFPL